MCIHMYLIDHSCRGFPYPNNQALEAKLDADRAERAERARALDSADGRDGGGGGGGGGSFYLEKPGKSEGMRLFSL